MFSRRAPAALSPRRVPHVVTGALVRCPSGIFLLMGRLIFVTIILTCLSSSCAQCPNYCSGHGMCDTAGGSEQCLCFKGWMDADCSERGCPFEVSFVS